MAVKIAALGGGTGLASLLSGLKHFTEDVTAIVTVTDEGGSSGRLRRTRGVLPPGDLRNCLAALAEDGTLLARLFQYRFPAVKNGISSGDALEGHAFGNLFLTALADVAGGLDKALAAAARVLAVRGRVLPVTLRPTRLAARLEDGRRVLGETRVSLSGSRIQRVSLIPTAPVAGPGVLDVLQEADLIVLGPGSLYTSVIPPLLVKSVAQALARARGLRVYVCNVMTQPGETDRHTAADHLRAVLDHCRRAAGGRGTFVDLMLVHDMPPPPSVVRYYERYHSRPVRPPEATVVDGVRVVRRRVVEEDMRAGGLARHAPDRLAKALMGLL
jgi:uncharacterized cofD-like protein